MENLHLPIDYLMPEIKISIEEKKPCETIISGEAMKYAIDCMDVFEHWAERVHSKIEENDTVKVTLADAIRVVNDFYPISNKSQFAQSCGMTRELLYKYLPKGKDPTPPK